MLPNTKTIFKYSFGILLIHFSGALQLPPNDDKCLVNPDCVTVDTGLACGYYPKNNSYIPFENLCYLASYQKCKNIDLTIVPIITCIEHQIKQVRRVYEDSCPVFCPEHYSPVCGASKLQDYVYRAFKNSCFLHMINCRGQNEFSGYVEVPLSYCGDHAMKNIWKEQVIVSNSPKEEIY